MTSVVEEFVLSVADNTTFSDNTWYTRAMARPRLDDAAKWLRELLPGDWTVTVARSSRDRSGLQLTPPSGSVVRVDAKVLKDASPRAVAGLTSTDSPALVVADWISPRAREVLRSCDMNYIDATGNAEIKLDKPAVFIRTTGADRNPTPKPAPGPRLRGPKAWAVLRAIAETPPPFGVRELAAAVDVDPGYVSRVLRALEGEILITREPRGSVSGVEWEGVIRKATSTYSVFDSNETSTWVATSGPTRLVEDLAAGQAGEWAVTGSVAAARLAPVAGPEMAIIYTTDPERLASAGRLLPTEQGANVVLAVPYDPVVFEAVEKADGVPYVSPIQVAMDCLTGNARMPAEGEALIDWMRANEERWRRRELSPRSERGGGR